LIWREIGSCGQEGLEDGNFEEVVFKKDLAPDSDQNFFPQVQQIRSQTAVRETEPGAVRW
jgi:hypothetical protein